MNPTSAAGEGISVLPRSMMGEGIATNPSPIRVFGETIVPVMCQVESIRWWSRLPSKLPAPWIRRMRGYGTEEGPVAPTYDRFAPECVAKLFSRPN